MNQNNSLKKFMLVAISLNLFGLAGCGGGAETPQQAQKEPSKTSAKPSMDKLKVLDMPRTKSPEGARVYFSNITSGDKVSTPVTLLFGSANINITTAGKYEPNTGHHHLLIDSELPPMNQVFPADEQHIHFGGGQLETTIELTPGEHTLQLLLGDGNHVPHNPPVMSERIKITVK
jgi:hypothetical protein